MFYIEWVIFIVVLVTTTSSKAATQHRDDCNCQITVNFDVSFADEDDLRNQLREHFTSLLEKNPELLHGEVTIGATASRASPGVSVPKENESYMTTPSGLETSTSRTQNDLDGSITSTPTSYKDYCIASCDSTKCLRVELSEKIQFSEAEHICQKINGTLGSITNVSEYHDVRSCLVSLLSDGWPWTGVWTGMLYKDHKLKTGSGKILDLPDEVLHAKFNTSVTTPNIAISAHKNPNNVNQGIRNVHPEMDYYGALCEVEV